MDQLSQSAGDRATPGSVAKTEISASTRAWQLHALLHTIDELPGETDSLDLNRVGWLVTLSRDLATGLADEIMAAGRPPHRCDASAGKVAALTRVLERLSDTWPDGQDVDTRVWILALAKSEALALAEALDELPQAATGALQ